MWPAREQFDACIHCGLCLSACPTYVETGREPESPRGRIQLMKELASDERPLDADTLRHLDLCLGCRACETACPSGVAYGSILEQSRAAIEAANLRPPREQRRRARILRTLTDPRRAARWLPLLRLAHRLGLPKLADRAGVSPRLRRLAALLPPVPARAALREPVPAPEGGERVALLSGCVNRVLFPELNRTAVSLLRRAGFDATEPPFQNCCGALAAHMGEREEARRLAKKNVNVFLRARPRWIATTTAGCGAFLRDYGELLADDPVYGPAARDMAGRVRDVTEVLREGSLPEPVAVPGRSLAIHDACHLVHGQGVTEAPRSLLAAIPGIELRELGDGGLCCGSAGTYNLVEPEMADRLGRRKAEAIRNTEADAVVAGNPGCALQIRASLRLAGHDVPVLHPVEILAEAFPPSE